MGCLSVLDSTGDTRLQWDKSNMEEVSAAKRRFDEFKKKGYAAFRVNKSGDKGEQIDGFDANAERLVLLPPMVGG